MEVKKVMSKDIAVLTLKGNFLCEPDKTQLRDELYRLMDDKIKNVIVDLGEVHCINSEGLGALVMGLTSLRRGGGDLRLARVGSVVKSTLEVTKLWKVFSSFDSADTAIASFNARIK